MAEEECGKEQRGSVLERVSASIGFIVAAMMIGFIGWKAASSGDGGPPEVSLTPTHIVRADGSYVVEIVARNAGSQTAANVQVEGILRHGRDVVERSQATLDYVPSRSERHGGIFFSHDPHRYRLEIRPTGYQEP